ncbi:MAG TPA: hypothetical protein VF170_19870, partial [Planctomycetaceae bacterium]
MALSAAGVLLYGCLVVAVATPGSFAPIFGFGSEPEAADLLEDGTPASLNETDPARRSLPQMAETAPTGDPSTLPAPPDPTGSELVASLAPGNGEEPFFSSTEPAPPAGEVDGDGTTTSAPGRSVPGSFGPAGSLYPAAGGPGSFASLSGADAFLPPGTPASFNASPTPTNRSGGDPSPTGGDSGTGDNSPSDKTGPGTSTGDKGTGEPGDLHAGDGDGGGADTGRNDDGGNNGGKNDGDNDPIDLTDNDPPPSGTGDGG